MTIEGILVQLKMKLAEAKEDARELPETVGPAENKNHPAAYSRGKVYAYQTAIELLESLG